MQPKKARSQPPPRRSKALDDAQNAATQVLDRMEAPHQRHRGVDDIADHKIDLLTVNWMLFHEFASRRDLAVPPFQLPRRKVDLVQQAFQNVLALEKQVQASVFNFFNKSVGPSP